MYKSKVKELCQKRKCHPPHQQGLDHSPRFHSTVFVDDLSFCSPSLFKSKKDAENDAVRLAYDHLVRLPPSPVPSVLALATEVAKSSSTSSIPPLERIEELELKEQHLKSLQLSIEVCNKKLKTMNEQHDSLQKSVIDCSKEFESQEQNLASAKKSLEECYEEIASKEAHLETIQRIFSELSKELMEKEKCFGSLKKTLQEHLDTQFEAIDKEVSAFRSTLECVSNYSSEKKKAERRDSFPNFHTVSTSLSMDQPPVSLINKRPRVKLDTTSDMPLSS